MQTNHVAIAAARGDLWQQLPALSPKIAWTPVGYDCSGIDSGAGFFGAGFFEPGPTDAIPQVVSIAVAADGLSVVLTYDTTLTANSPTTTQFTLAGNHVIPSIAGASASGTAVTLTFAAGYRILKWDSSITLAYDAAGATKIQSIGGQIAGAFSAQSATNSSTIMQEATGLFQISHPASATATNSASLTAASDLQNAAWTKNEMTPTGATTATVDVAATNAYITQTVTNCAVDSALDVPTVYTRKFKYADIQWMVIEKRAGVASGRVWIDVQNHVIGTTGSEWSGCAWSGPDGGGYYTFTGTSSKNGGVAIFRVYPSSTDVVITQVVGGTVDMKEADVAQTTCSSTNNIVSGSAATQAVKNIQPAYSATGGANSKPALLGAKVATVNATNFRCLTTTETALINAGSGDDIAFTKMIVISGQGDAVCVYSGHYGTGNRRIELGTDNAGTGRWTVSKHDGTTNVNATSSANSVTTPAVVEAFGPGTTLDIQENGAAANPNDAALNVTSTTMSSYNLLGRATASSLQGWFNSDVFAGSEVDSTTRGIWRAHFGAHYGIAVS